MSDTEKKELGAGAGDAASPGGPVSQYEVVPYSETSKDADLYSFRTALDEDAPAPAVVQVPHPGQIQPQEYVPLPRPPLDLKKILLIAAGAGGALLLAGLLALVIINKQEPIPPFIDLGVGSLPAEGLSGRLIAKWDGKAVYEIHIDPQVPQQISGFSAVAADPPYPLSIDLRIKSESGSILCRKEIVFPFNAPPEPGAIDTQQLLPQQSLTGDTVQNVAAPDGRIAEMLVSGPLPCPLKAYRGFATWEFSSNFPDLGSQQDWLRRQESMAADIREKSAEARARAAIPPLRHLSSPIDGEDVIVSENPSRGTVQTGSGRTFYIGIGRSPGWQVFPANIHFHCDIRSNCILTRPDASSSLNARLVR